MPSAAPSRCRDPARGRAELLFRGCGAARACAPSRLHRARRHDPSIARRSGSRRREPCSPTSTDRAVGPAGRDRAAATALASRYAVFRAGIEASLVMRSDSRLLLLFHGSLGDSLSGGCQIGRPLVFRAAPISRPPFTAKGVDNPSHGWASSGVPWRVTVCHGVSRRSCGLISMV